MFDSGRFSSALPGHRRFGQLPLRRRTLTRASLAGALLAGLIVSESTTRTTFADEPPQGAGQTLDSRIVEQLPRSGSAALSIRCGDLKFYGIATVRNEKGTKVCVFGPVVSPSEGERLAELPDQWRMFPFARIRLERAEAAPGGGVLQTAAPHESWLIEVPESIVGLIASGDCTVGRYEPDLEADGTRPQGFSSYKGFDEIAAVHRRAVQGWGLAGRVRELRIAAAEASLDEETRRLLDAERSAVEGEAQAWLRGGVCLPPPYALGLVAWIEEMDARQYLHRSVGQVKAADRVVATIRGQAQGVGANGLLQLLAERVPPGQDGATSLCLHRCWVSDASEVNAIGTREHSAQKRFVAELRDTLSRDSDCGKAAVEVEGYWFDRLLGALPPGARFDDRIKTIATAELAAHCGADRSRPALRIVAMTVSLKVFTACWTEALESYPELKERLAAWHDTLRREIVAMLESPGYASALPPEDMQQVTLLALQRLESVFNDGIGYFTAFPPSEAMQQKVLARFREFAGSRGFAVSEPTNGIRTKIAHQVTNDLLECLYEVTALQATHREDPDAYPRPFEFGPKAFKLWGQEMNWSVGP